MNKEKRYSIYMTRDYGEFKLLDGNRDPEKATRLKKLGKSIKEVGFLPTPIIVNEKYEVIDGQARLKTAEKLGEPVYFMIVPGIGLPECVALNQASTAWTLRDYVDSYAELGNTNYSILRSYIDRYRSFTPSVIVYVLCGVDSAGSVVKSGHFTVNEEYEKDADRMLALMERCLPLLEKVWKGRTMMALCYCFRQDDVDNERLIKAIKSRANTIDRSYSRIVDWVATFEAMYNYKLQNENRVYLVDRYRKAFDENAANTSRKYDAKRGKKRGRTDE